jgi:1,4-dihydroxy-2-naphthoate octaprenyltransferase
MLWVMLLLLMDTNNAVAWGHCFHCCCYCRLSYKGLGEPLCYTAFGPLATTAFYLAQLPATTGLSTAAAAPGAAAASAAATTAAAAVSSGLEAVPSLVWCYSAIVGVTTAVILFCSHFHQIQGDMAAGKVSPLVRLGTQQGCTVSDEWLPPPPRVCAAAPGFLAAA